MTGAAHQRRGFKCLGSLDGKLWNELVDFKY